MQSWSRLAFSNQHLIVLGILIELLRWNLEKISDCREPKVHYRHTQGLWVDFMSGRKSPWGRCLTRLVPNCRSRSGIWLVQENFCVFLPNQSEVLEFLCFNTVMYKKLSYSPCLFGRCDEALIEVKSFSFSTQCKRNWSDCPRKPYQKLYT